MPGPPGDLPSYEAVRRPLLRQARLCRESQALNHALRFAPVEDRIDEWAAQTAGEAGAGRHASSGGSCSPPPPPPRSTSAPCSPSPRRRAQARPTPARVESAYFPWASGLNALLDSLVDLDEDPEDASHLRRYDIPGDRRRAPGDDRLRRPRAGLRAARRRAARGDPRGDGRALSGSARGVAPGP